VEVEESLLRLTHLVVGCWMCMQQLILQIKFERASSQQMNFLSSMMMLSRVFIQDAAAMLVLFLKKIEHPLFWLKVFCSV
jgi:hypothetical protein